MRDLRIPPPPDRFRSSAHTAEALRAREIFVRAAAEAWQRAGQPSTAERLTDAADASRAVAPDPFTPAIPRGSRS